MKIQTLTVLKYYSLGGGIGAWGKGVCFQNIKYLTCQLTLHINRKLFLLFPLKLSSRYLRNVFSIVNIYKT